MPDGEDAAPTARAPAAGSAPASAPATAPSAPVAHSHSAPGRDHACAPPDLRGPSSSSASQRGHAPRHGAPPLPTASSSSAVLPPSTSTSTPTSTPTVPRRRPHSPTPPRSPPRTVMASTHDHLAEPPDEHGPCPSQIAPMLCCPCCPPGARLVEPVTLRCGHTVCAVHLRPSKESNPRPTTPTCPLPTCQPTARDRNNTLQPRIPRSSSVVYIPANIDADPDEAATTLVPTIRTDVTVSKVLAVVAAAECMFAREDVGVTLQQPPEDETSDEGSDDDGDDNDDDAGSEGGNDDNDNDAPELPSLVPARPATPVRRSSVRRPASPGSAPGSPSSRPRKRRRGLGRAVSPPAPPPASLRPWFQKELLSELTCEICYMIFYQPVTTPCQHTFCSNCLQRSLDHSSTCPLCREEMPDYAYFQDQSFSNLLLAILLNVFKAEYQERGETIAAEERDARLDTPVFVGQLSFPGMPTFLHFFEPRYRLMLRRCLESPQHRFGMVSPPRAGTGAADYGTMLEIRSVQVLPDGRSVVETWGTHRFRIVERGTLDGYMVARIEHIDDYAAELPEPALRVRAPGDAELMHMCREFLEQLRRGTAPWVVQRLNNTYGPMPTDPAAFSFWMALVLPIDEHEKTKLLPIRSPRLRLRMIVHWIESLNSNWWFTSGCVIA